MNTFKYIILIWLCNMAGTYAQSYFQGFEETSTRPSCWSGATFSNKLWDSVFDGRRAAICGTFATGYGGSKPNWLKTAQFNLTAPSTSQWIMLWYRTTNPAIAQPASFRIVLENQSTMALTPVSNWVDALAAGYDWESIKLFFPSVTPGNYKIVIEASSSTNTLAIDAVEASVNINNTSAILSSVSIAITGGSNPNCSAPITFTATAVNPQTPVSYTWILNYDSVGTTLSYTCDTCNYGDSAYIIMHTGSPCPTHILSNKIAILPCASDIIIITNTSPEQFCKGAATGSIISFNTTLPATPVYEVELSQPNTKLFSGTPPVLGTGVGSPISISIPDTLAPGKYYLRIHSSSGVYSNNLDSITVYTPPVAYAGSDINLCFGIARMLTASGGASYIWNTGHSSASISVNPPVTTNYRVTVTDANGCKDEDTVMVNVLQLTAASAITHVSCTGGTDGSITVSPSGGITPYLYIWSNSATIAQLTSLSTGIYRVTVSDNNSCLYSSSFTVTQAAGITITPSVTHASCAAGGNGALSVTLSGGFTPYTVTWNTGSTVQTITGLSSGTYNITVTDNKGCVKSSALIITEAAGITASFSASHVSCNSASNGSLSVTAGGGLSPYTILWSTGTYCSGSVCNIAGLTAGNYQATVTDNNNCRFVSSCTITQPVAIGLTASITHVACMSDNIGVISIIPAGGQSPYSFLWSTGSTTSSISSLTVGNYAVTLTDNYGCSLDTVLTVNENSGIIIYIITLQYPTCYTTNDGSLDIDVTGGFSPYTYQWSTSGTTQDASNLSPGMQYVTVSDIMGCNTIGIFNISQPLPINPQLQTYSISCYGLSNGTVASNPTGGTSPYNYLWSSGETDNAIGAKPAGTYSITVTDTKNCIATASTIVTQPTLLSVTTSKNNILCIAGSNGSLTANPAGGTGPYFYYWNTGATTSSILNLSAGTYCLTIADNRGCTKTGGCVQISEPDPVNIGGTIHSVECNGGNDGFVLLTVTGGNTPFTYFWSTAETTKDIYSLPFGNYSVTITDRNDCKFSYPFTINQPDGFDIADTVNKIRCFGVHDGSIYLTVTGSTGPYKFIWTIGNTTQGISGLGAGTYRVSVTDNNNCPKIRQYIITSPQPIILSSTTVPVCDSMDGELRIYASGGTGDITFHWHNGETVSHLFDLNPGSYRVTATDSAGCTKADTVTLGAPTGFSILPFISNPICPGDNMGSITIEISGGVPPYNVIWSDGTNTFDNSTMYSLDNLGGGTYAVSVTDNRNCKSSKIFMIKDIEPFTLDTLQLRRPYCPLSDDGLISIGITGGTPPYMISWTGNQQGLTASNLTMGEYTIHLTDSHQCSIDYTIALHHVSDYCLYIPNIFTPNNDGINDTWEIPGITRYYPSATVEIFNRWGTLVYRSTGYETPWNGKHKNIRQPFDSYHYIIHLNDLLDEVITGHVTIIR